MQTQSRIRSGSGEDSEQVGEAGDSESSVVDLDDVSSLSTQCEEEEAVVVEPKVSKRPVPAVSDLHLRANSWSYIM